MRTWCGAKAAGKRIGTRIGKDKKVDWRLDPSKTGVLVVDLQERLLPVIHEGQRVLKKARDLLAIAKIFSLPVLVTEQVPEKLGPSCADLRELLDGCLIESKSDFSCVGVLPPDFPKTVVIAGVETHVCVRQTVYDLRLRGRVPYVLGDAVGSRYPLDHELALGEMRRDEVLVTSLEAVAWELVRSAKTPQFSQVLTILK
jgi:isochorismate hydrolase